MRNIWKIIAAGLTFVSAGQWDFRRDVQLLATEHRENPRFFAYPEMQVEIPDADVPRGKIVYINAVPVIVRDPNIVYVVNNIDYPRFQEFFEKGETNENISSLIILMGWREVKGLEVAPKQSTYTLVDTKNGLIKGTKLYIDPAYRGKVCCNKEEIADIVD
jgi:hypothetical protein